MDLPDIASMGELEAWSFLYWLLTHDGREPRVVTVYPFDLAIDIVLPAGAGDGAT